MNDNSDPPTTNQDRACAWLAREALFPLKIDWKGTHRTLFPALEALDRVRQDLAQNLPSSKLFPKRVVLVGGSDQLQWNGQPDVGEKDATVEVIPLKLTVKCMDCSSVEKGLQAFVRTRPQKDASSSTSSEIVLCTNHLLQKDYRPGQRLEQRDLPPRSLAAVEQALAHEITKLGEQLQLDKPATCPQVAAMELRAALAAECYYGKAEKEVRKGSNLPVGYSTFPSYFQRVIRDRCIRSVAAYETCRTFGSQGKTCVDEVFEQVDTRR